MWRLILGDGSGLMSDGPTNMAVDQTLLDSVRAGGAPVLRFYRWAPACLSFGRNQPARGRYDETAAADRGIDFVRRPTGGQAVLHDDELTYAVVAPITVIGRPRAAYHRINHALVAGLRRLGLEAEVAGPVDPAGRGGPDWSRACFRTPAAGELVVRGRKLVGSAQRTEGGVILQHGSILAGGSQAAAEALVLARVAVGADEIAPAPPGDWTTLTDELGERPAMETLARELGAGFEGALGISLAPTALTPGEAGDAHRLRGRFASAAWTWRR